MILSIRTDKPEAEIGLFDGQSQADYEKWTAHRELSSTLLVKIQELLEQNSLSTTDLSGIMVFKGPGSFTGLRIGITVANTLAYSLPVPIVSQGGDDWRTKGIERLENGDDESIALPEYGAEANVTQPKK